MPIEAGIVALSLSRDWLPPSLNLSEPGSDCALRYVEGEGESFQAEYVLSNSFGFGASLVLRRAEV